MGSPTKEWGEPPSPGLVLCQTSTQDLLKTEPINNNMKKVSASIMHMGDTILDAVAEAGAFSTTILHATHLLTENNSQISEVLHMGNMYVSILTGSICSFCINLYDRSHLSGSTNQRPYK